MPTPSPVLMWGWWWTDKYALPRQSPALSREFKVNHFTSFDAQCGTTDHCASWFFTRSSAYHSEKMVVWFSGSADKACATVRDRYGQLPPSTCRLLAAEVFRLTAKRTLMIRPSSRRENGRPICSSSRIVPARFYTYIQSRPGHRYSPTFYGVVHMPFPVIFMGITQRKVIPPCAETVWERVGKTLESTHRSGHSGKFAAPRAYLRRRTNHNCIKFSDWQFHHTPHTTRIHKSRKPPVQRQSPVAASAQGQRFNVVGQHLPHADPGMIKIENSASRVNTLVNAEAKNQSRLHMSARHW